jgi:hypothetical protein
MVHATLPLGRTHCAKSIDPSQGIYQERKEFLMTHQQQQTEQPSQVVLNELNEQDLAVVAGGMIAKLPLSPRVLTPEDVERIKRNPLGVGPEVRYVPKGPSSKLW